MPRPSASAEGATETIKQIPSQPHEVQRVRSRCLFDLSRERYRFTFIHRTLNIDRLGAFAINPNRWLWATSLNLKRSLLKESSVQIRLTLQINNRARSLVDELQIHPPANLLHTRPSRKVAWRKDFYCPCLVIS